MEDSYDDKMLDSRSNSSGDSIEKSNAYDIGLGQTYAS